MQIRTRLTLQFLLLGGLIMIIASSASYLFSARFRMEDFYTRLRDKALNTANVLFNTDRLNASRILKIEDEVPDFLQNKKIIIINFKNDIVYSSDDKSEIDIKNYIVERVRMGSIVTYKQDKFNVIGTLFYTNYDRFVILAAATDVVGSLHLEKLRVILFIVCFVSLALFFIAGWFYSGRALKPISAVVKSVEDISITSLNLRVFEGNGVDEIG